MTNRNAAKDDLSRGWPYRFAPNKKRLWATIVIATVIVGCGEKSPAEPRVDADAAKALRAKLLGDEAPADRSAE